MKKNKTLRLFILVQFMIVSLFLFLTLGNEIVDIPHYLFHDAPTTASQRTGEIAIELTIFAIVLVLQTLMFLHLYKQIKVLEGLLPICANCKKIRNEKNHWEQMEAYIATHSLAEFSHSICPDCAKLLYPELYDDQFK